MNKTKHIKSIVPIITIPQFVSEMTIINKLNLTQDEETCIMRFLTQVRQSGADEEWYPVIDSIVQKYISRKYQQQTEAQHWQTL